MTINKKFTIGLLMIVIVMIFGVILLSVLDVYIADASINMSVFPILINSEVEDRPYPLPTDHPTPHPYPSPTLPPSPSPSPSPILNQYLPILFDSILENFFEK